MTLSEMFEKIENQAREVWCKIADVKKADQQGDEASANMRAELVAKASELSQLAHRFAEFTFDHRAPRGGAC